MRKSTGTRHQRPPPHQRRRQRRHRPGRPRPEAGRSRTSRRVPRRIRVPLPGARQADRHDLRIFQRLRRRSGTRRFGDLAEGAIELRGQARQAQPRSNGYYVTGPQTTLTPARPGPAPHGPIVQMTDVVFAWPGRNAFTLSIDRFTLHKGERLLLIGPSGGGKSTFLSLLAGIVTPQAGVIDVLGTDIARLRGAARDRFRAEHLGIIFQMFNLLPYGSVIDNVVLPLSFSAGRRERAEAEGGAKARRGKAPAKPRHRAGAQRRFRRELKRGPAAARGRRPRAHRLARACGRRRADILARPQPAAGLPRSAVRGPRGGQCDADHGQPRRKPGARFTRVANLDRHRPHLARRHGMSKSSSPSLLSLSRKGREEYALQRMRQAPLPFARLADAAA